jgi:TfoX N-terminal domain
VVGDVDIVAMDDRQKSRVNRPCLLQVAQWRSGGQREHPPFVDDAGMAYDEDLANRIRELIAGEPDVSEQGMFGGLAFLVGGNMSVAISGQGGLMVRVDREDTDELLAKPHAQSGDARVVARRRGGRENQAPARALGQARRRVRPPASVEAVAFRAQFV